MATTTKFSFTNDTPDDKEIQMYNLGILTNYGQQWQSDGSICYTNATTPPNQKELAYYKSVTIPSVQNNLDLGGEQSAKKGIHYGVRLEETVVTTVNGQDGCCEKTYEDPLVINIMIRHPNTNYITTAMVEEALGRAMSLIIKSGSTATHIVTDIGNLMRGVVQITSE